ncbi:MAG: recombinase RecT [Selenomonadaceae bacterium]|nr:recombinase RecT [Selenomonadaceae bacterium]
MAELPQRQQQSLQQVLDSEGVRKRFVDVLGDSAAPFISSVLTTVNSNEALKRCSTASILSAAATAAALRLPVSPALGLAHIIPYGQHAAFQLGYKGIIQLALRSGQYRRINSAPVLDGQIKEVDFLTGDIVRGEAKSNQVVGYIAYIELHNGFSKTLYMTIDELEKHASTFSKSYAYDKKYGKRTSVWSLNFDSMAKKTVLKLLLSKYGLLSIEAASANLVNAFAEPELDRLDEGNITLQFDEVAPEDEVFEVTVENAAAQFGDEQKVDDQ